MIALFLNSTDKTVMEYNQTIILSKTPLKPGSTKNPLDEVILEPSMEFMQTITPATIKPKIVTTQLQTPPQKAIIAKKNLPLSPPPSTSIIPSSSHITLPSSPPTNPKAPSIKHGSNPIDISEIEERFKNNPSPQLGLYLARYYYEHKDYNEAYNYALKTNSINKDVEESWLIFSRSLVKLGKVDQAKKTLQYYISQSHSENAKDLLNSIEQGNVK